MDLSLPHLAQHLQDLDSLDSGHDALAPTGFRDAAVIVPLVARDEGLNLIFNKRAANLDNHAGQVGFPGGRRDPVDRSLQDTAQRELQEELGIDPARHQVLRRLPARLVISHYQVTPFVSLVDPHVPIVPDPGEVAYAFEVPLAHLVTPGTQTAAEREIFGEPRTFYAWEWQGEVIWGATGRIIADLLRALGADHVDP